MVGAAPKVVPNLLLDETELPKIFPEVVVVDDPKSADPLPKVVGCPNIVEEAVVA